MKRVVRSIVIAVALVFAVGSNLTARAAEGFFSHGDGSFDNPYLIANQEDLRYFALNGEEGSYYALACDIELTTPWQPVETFDGVLDGRGFTIYGIEIDETTAQENSGFFRHIGDRGYVKNLRLEGSVTVTAQDTESISVGGLAGFSAGRVESCHSNVQIIVLSTDSRVNGGGLVGINEGTLFGCSAIGDLEMKSSIRQAIKMTVMGGLIGSNRGTVANSYATGDVVALAGNEIWVGGTVGYQGANARYTGLYWCTDSLQREGDWLRASEYRWGIGNRAADADICGKDTTFLASRDFADLLNHDIGGQDQSKTTWLWETDLHQGYPYSITEESSLSEDVDDNFGDLHQSAASQELLPLDLSEIDYYIDAERMLILSPTGDQIRWIVETAYEGQILLDLSAFVGASGVGITLTEMDWWFDGSGDKLTVFLTTGEAVTINDGMFNNPRDIFADGNIMIRIKKQGVTVSLLQNGSEVVWENLREPLVVSIHYDTVPAQNPHRLVMAESTDSGESQRIIPRSWYEEEEERVYAKVYSTGSYDAKYSVDVVYADVSGKWMEQAVNYTTARGVIAEKANGFAPDDTVTRVEFVRMLMRLLDVDITDYDNHGFTDEYAIPLWGIDAVNKALDMGIITGDANENFNPLEEITRQDMMVILYRALDVLGMIPADILVENADFTDIHLIKDYALEAVNVLAALDLVHGYNGNMNPNGVATRAEVVQMFYNILAWDVAVR